MCESKLIFWAWSLIGEPHHRVTPRQTAKTIKRLEHLLYGLIELGPFSLEKRRFVGDLSGYKHLMRKSCEGEPDSLCRDIGLEDI